MSLVGPQGPEPVKLSPVLQSSNESLLHLAALRPERETVGTTYAAGGFFRTAVVRLAGRTYDQASLGLSFVQGDGVDPERQGG